MHQTNARKALLMTSGALALTLAVSTGAKAQTASGPRSADAEGTIGEVVVTASRVERQGFVAPTPTTVLGQREMELRAPASAVNLLNEVPSFRPSSTSISRPAFQGSGPVSADLRGLGNRRTLTLVDKQRFTPAAASGVVDLNLIPTNMIERAEVVTGGASAAYGSDAVSGVVNFITKKRITGIEGEISGGIAQAGDDGKGHVALATGGVINDGRGHFAIGGEYYHEGIVADTYARDWGQKETGTVIYPAGARPAGQPARLVVDHVRTTNQSTFGGVIIGPNAAALQRAYFGNTSQEIQFGTGGTILPYAIGQAFGTSSIGGGNYGETGGRLLSLSPEQNRYSLLTNLDYEITPSITATAQFNYAKSDTFFLTASRRDFNTTSTTTNPNVTPTDYILIKSDNAYLPSPISSIMTANNIGNFYLGRVLRPRHGQRRRQQSDLAGAVRPERQGQQPAGQLEVGCLGRRRAGLLQPGLDQRDHRISLAKVI